MPSLKSITFHYNIFKAEKVQEKNESLQAGGVYLTLKTGFLFSANDLNPSGLSLSVFHKLL
jgi:hypothetical protein